MRTEQLLRETIDDLGATLRDSELSAQRILHHVHRRRRPAARRIAVILVAAVTVLVVAALLVPGLIGRRQAVPADQRVPGNWNQVVRVVPPSGWEIVQQVVAPTVETTVLQPRGRDGEGACTVSVLGPGVPDPNAGQGAAGTVSGRPGTWRVGDGVTESPLGHLTWSYRDGAWADVSCLARSDAQRIADEIQPGPVTTRIPFTLEPVPSGFRVDVVLVALPGGEPPAEGGVVLRAGDSDPALGITLVDSAPSVVGREQVLVDGRPAVLVAEDHQVCLPTGRTYVCVQLASARPPEQLGPLTDDQRRLLLDTAADLRLAPDPDDAATWFVANDVLPR